MQLSIDDASSLYTELKPDWLERSPKSVSHTPFLSFFTGAGFLDLGFISEGFSAAWHNELNPYFIAGFECGMSHATKKTCTIENTESVTTVGPKRILREAFGNVAPAVFGMIGGPPCPDFSIGGKNRGEHGDHGKLTQVYANRICEIRPTFFVLENVKGLLKTATHRTFFARILKQLERHGYMVDYSVLNALDFGVPQDRERVFVVGFQSSFLARRGLVVQRGVRGWYPWPRDERYYRAKQRYSWPTVAPFGTNAQKPDEVPAQLTVWSVISDTAALEVMPNGKDCFVAYSPKFHTIMEGDSSRKSFKRLHRWRYSPTAAYGNNEVHLHPTLPRRLSVREALRIQSAPDAYQLPSDMPLSQKFKTIGNAVPVTLARALARSIRTFLD